MLGRQRSVTSPPQKSFVVLPIRTQVRSGMLASQRSCWACRRVQAYADMLARGMQARSEDRTSM